MVQLSYSCMIGTRTISSFLKSGLGEFGKNSAMAPIGSTTEVVCQFTSLFFFDDPPEGVMDVCSRVLPPPGRDVEPERPMSKSLPVRTS
jgi:hypothetical protein